MGKKHVRICSGAPELVDPQEFAKDYALAKRSSFEVRKVQAGSMEASQVVALRRRAAEKRQAIQREEQFWLPMLARKRLDAIKDENGEIIRGE